MLRDRTADHLRGKASNLREIAGAAEDECVRQAMLTNAADLDRLVDMITPVLTGEKSPELSPEGNSRNRVE